MLAIAYYVGNPTSEESVMGAFARALGYPSSFELGKSMEACDADFSEKSARAENKLFEKFGVTRSDKSDVIFDAYGRMEVGLSEWYKKILQSSFTKYGST
jgi:hypothetical protein